MINSKANKLAIIPRESSTTSTETSPIPPASVMIPMKKVLEQSLPNCWAILREACNRPNWGDAKAELHRKKDVPGKIDEYRKYDYYKRCTR